MSENPFQTPQHEYGSATPNVKTGRIPGLSMVNQVTVVAIMMLVQGALLLLMSAFAFFYAFGFTSIIRNLPQENQAGEEFPEEMLFWITVIGGLIGGFMLLLALMHFLAGYWGLKLEGRMFGITTLILGIGASATFYCAPTAIGLAIYGLIIYFNGPVKQAFEFRAKGMPKQEVVNQFY